jgi:hypothetical protein
MFSLYFVGKLKMFYRQFVEKRKVSSDCKISYIREAENTETK